jgi:hypothetical protein
MRYEAQAYPFAMLTLAKLGLVVSRPGLGPGRKISAWFITREGREQLAEIDASKPGARAAPTPPPSRDRRAARLPAGAFRLAVLASLADRAGTHRLARPSRLGSRAERASNGLGITTPARRIF